MPGNFIHLLNIRSIIFKYLPAPEVKVKVAQSCPTLCDPKDYIAHGIL